MPRQQPLTHLSLTTYVAICSEKSEQVIVHLLEPLPVTLPTDLLRKHSVQHQIIESIYDQVTPFL